MSAGRDGDRLLCGWRVRSAVALRELPAWAGGDRAPDLEIMVGPVPPREDLTKWNANLDVASDGTCRLDVDDVAVYEVNADGSRVTIDPRLSIDAPDIRVFLLGTVLAIVAMRRSLLPLHASCVRIGSRAVAFAGPSGAGKSTIAAAFARRGHALVSDDVTVVDVSGAGGPDVLPSVPQLKLWRGSMEWLEWRGAGLETSLNEPDKFHVPAEALAAGSRMPLAAIYLLGAPGATPGPRLTATQSISAISRALYRPKLSDFLLGAPAVFTASGRIAARVVVEPIDRGVDFTSLDAVIDRVTRDVAS